MSTLATASLLVALTAGGAAQAGQPAPNPLRDAYYGDLHLHTTFSFDAYVLFGTRVTPDVAYRFARGEAVPYLGHLVRRKEPLDFLAVTDHSENIGVLNELDDPESVLSRSDLGREIRSAGPKTFQLLRGRLKSGFEVAGFDRAATSRAAWQKEIEAANQNYRPGVFTTLIGYEWTSSPDGQNLHRNVIFRGGSAPPPFTAQDSKRPEDLWAFLEGLRRQGIEALAIPHNANASDGLMYDWVTSDGKPIDQAYAQQRATNEPLSEISQNKGQSETHPVLSPSDEFAGFEVMDRYLASPKHSEVHGSYVREAYGRGLAMAEKIGVNPYKFGVVGASDFHNGLSASGEDAYGGEANGIDPRYVPEKQAVAAVHEDLAGQLLLFGSGNLTGVWAEQNTRESIYDALRRKETFATSGTRLKFRFFGGWGYDRRILESESWVETAYEQGVPMGGDLPSRPAGAGAPRFVVQAVKDPDGARLDRVQVVKVWLADGKQQEKVFDVAWSGGRRVDRKAGKLPPVGNTVDVRKATYRNRIGAAQLAAVWEDREFDPTVPAVYYLRVLEIPTPRWSTILAVKRKQPLPKGVAATIQERGWSSPIWYTPAKRS